MKHASWVQTTPLLVHTGCLNSIELLANGVKPRAGVAVF
jgi:hypothetical protein